MSNSMENNEVNTESSNNGVVIGWIFHLIGLFTGIFYLVGFIWALVKKGKDNSDFEKSHYKKMISMTVITGIIYIVSAILLFYGLYSATATSVNTMYHATQGVNYSHSSPINAPMVISFIAMSCVYIWNIVRIIKGLMKSLKLKSY